MGNGIWDMGNENWEKCKEKEDDRGKTSAC